MANTPFIPTWKRHEKDLHTSDKAVEAFDETRKREIATSKRAADWEESRKEEWAKNKPKVVQDRIKSQNQELDQFKKELSTAGAFDSYFQPMPSLLVVQADEREQQTEGGIFLPDTAGELQNSGVVKSVGGVRYSDLSELHHPVPEGAHVIFKKGAGLDIELKWGKCKLMQYTDILGILE
jgi:chaperonin GroES